MFKLFLVLSLTYYTISAYPQDRNTTEPSVLKQLFFTGPPLPFGPNTAIGPYYCQISGGGISGGGGGGGGNSICPQAPAPLAQCVWIAGGNCGTPIPPVCPEYCLVCPTSCLVVAVGGPIPGTCPTECGVCC